MADGRRGAALSISHQGTGAAAGGRKSNAGNGGTLWHQRQIRVQSLSLLLRRRTKETGQKYSTSKLLKSKHLAGYQRDFARVILTEPEYTIEEARKLLDERLKDK